MAILSNGVFLDAILYAQHHGYQLKEIAAKFNISVNQVRAFKETKVFSVPVRRKVLETLAALQIDISIPYGLKLLFPRRRSRIQLSRNQVNIIMTRYWLAKYKSNRKLSNLIDYYKHNPPTDYELALYNFSLWVGNKKAKSDTLNFKVGLPFFFAVMFKPMEKSIPVTIPNKEKKEIYLKFVKGNQDATV